MINFMPSWTETWTAEQAEKELGIKFNGPGWYKNGSDTMLVIPTDRRASELWKAEYTPDETFRFNVFSGFSPADAFALINEAPERPAY